MPARKIDVHAESAAAVVAVVLDGEGFYRDHLGAPEGTHDFDIELGDGRLVAVEVTRLIRGRQLAQHKAQPPWFSDRLGLSWWLVLLDDQVSVGTLRQTVEDQLAAAERDLAPSPLRAVEGSFEAEMLEPLPAGLARLGIVAALYFPARLPVGDVRLSIAHEGFRPLDDALDELEHVLADNIEKLSRANADERHLFVWVDNPHPTIGTWLHSERLPGRALRVPAPIDAIWVAPVHGTSTGAVTFTDRIWCFRPGDGWSTQRRGQDFWRALDMRNHLRLPPDPDSPSTAGRYRPK